ncbi:PdxA Pyridoxal phosphate biosynthesis protein [Rhabdaerophilaceae bacterium]
MTTGKPVVAHVIGCPAGIAPELSARMLADADLNEMARLIAIGDARILAYGARTANVSPSLTVVGENDPIPAGTGPVLIDLPRLDPVDLRIGELHKPAGIAAMANFQKGLSLAAGGQVDALTFSPFNKASMRLAHPSYEDEVVFMNEFLDFKGIASEFNILPDLWNARVTSHVPISGVTALITKENVMRALRLTNQAMHAAGFSPPRIALAGLNPHAGDGGNFGREEIDVLEPLVAAAQAEGIHCAGPFPSDTVFVRARKGEFDGVLTMYHDQGQIAMKLIGFDQGVTMLGGYRFPIATAAHGSAYDIAGKGIANPGAMHNAMKLAIKMAGAGRGER